MKGTGQSVEGLLLQLPKNERVVVKRLRMLIQDCLPKTKEEPKYGYGIPFYTRQRMICFIWPSIYRGLKRKEKTKRTNLVTLGFCQGHLMSNEDGVPQSEGRKQAYCMYINSLSEINEEHIRARLFEADMIDQGFGQRRK